MKIKFKLSEFNISGEDIPEIVADKILEYHITPMIPVRNELAIIMYPSLKSGYRSPRWESDHKRSGTSQHVFKGKGAVDWTCKDFENNKKALLESIIKHTEYNRMAIYNSFIHCDYASKSNRREVFSSTNSSKWTFKRFV